MAETNLPSHDLQQIFGNIDVYLFDQLLKGRLPSGIRLLDVGCGTGRNLVYFLRHDYEVFGIDQSPHCVDQARRLASELSPGLSADNFRTDRAECLSFPDAMFDAVIGNALLHFARDENHFRGMAEEMWRVLKPGGLFFARLASSIGIETRVRSLGGKRFLLPDGSERFLVDEDDLIRITDEMRGEFLEPIKTVNVQNQRCMTNWCLRKA